MLSYGVYFMCQYWRWPIRGDPKHMLLLKQSTMVMIQSTDLRGLIKTGF